MNTAIPVPRFPLLTQALLALGALVLALAHIRTTVADPDAARFSFDSAEYALAGRALLETGRLSTPFVHPAALGASPGPPYPLVVGHPMVPALDALAFAVAGKDPIVTLAPAVLAYVATVLLLARLALSLTGSLVAALGAAAAFAVTPWTLRFASEGLSEMPFTAFLTGAFLLLWRYPQHPRPALLGAVLGLCHLTRPVTMFLLPAFVVGLWFTAPLPLRLTHLLRAGAAFLPLASLTAIYKWAAAGSPFADVGGYLLLSGASPDLVTARLNRMTPPPEAMEWIRAHPGEWLAKLARNLRSVSYGAWWLGGRWPGAIAALACLVALVRGEPRARAFAITFAGSAALLTLLASATVADPRMLFPLLPPAIALSFAVLTRVAEALGRGRTVLVAGAAAGAILLGALPLAREWRAAKAGGLAGRGEFREREWRGLGENVAELLPGKDGLVASDAAPWIAWWTRRPVTLVPLEPADLRHGPQRLRPDAVVLTNEWLISRPGEGEWKKLFDERRPPPGFRLAGHVRSGRLEAVVFHRDAAP